MNSPRITERGRDATLLQIASRVWPNENFQGFSSYDLLHAKGSPFLAVTYSQLFWPDFTDFDGMVFFPWVIEDEDDRARVVAKLQQTDKTEVEKAFNFVEVSGLFGAGKAHTTPEEDRLLTEYLAAMWRAKLATSQNSGMLASKLRRLTTPVRRVLTVFRCRVTDPPAPPSRPATRAKRNVTVSFPPCRSVQSSTRERPPAQPSRLQTRVGVGRGDLVCHELRGRHAQTIGRRHVPVS